MNARVKPKKVWRVWIEQVNQTYIDVIAEDENEAYSKGYRKWRRECAHARISQIEKQVT